MIRFGVNADGREDVVVAARRAEALGFDSYGVGEHVFFHYPTVNAFVALAAAATATTRIDLFSSIALLPLYPPALLAKMATTLDGVSGGRFQLGVGVGGEHPPEFAACGVPLEERGARADASLAVLRTLWSGGTIGTIGDSGGVALAPQPVRPGGIPIWIAGRSPAALRRTARYGDGWMPLFSSPERFGRDLAALRDEAARHGRDPSTIRVGAVVLACVHDDVAVARTMIGRRLGENYTGDFTGLVERIAAAGPADECARRVEAFVAAGADTIFFAPLSDPAHAIENEERLAGDVVPRFR